MTLSDTTTPASNQFRTS